MRLLYPGNPTLNLFKDVADGATKFVFTPEQDEDGCIVARHKSRQSAGNCKTLPQFINLIHSSRLLLKH
jgi:hypothetical protein